MLSQTALEEQTLHRQQVVARSGSIMLKDFILSLERSESDFISDTTTITDIQLLQDRLARHLDQFADTPVSAVGVLDKNGKEIVAVDRGGGIFKGTDYSERLHFQWAKTAKTGEFYLSKPVVSKHGVEQGKHIGVLSTPIYLKGKFSGVLSMAFSISSLTKTYLDPIKLTDTSRVYLLTSDGTIIYSPIERLNGVNYFDIMAKQHYDGKDVMVANMHAALDGPGEGKFKGLLVNEETRELTNYLLAYSPIYFNNQKIWTLGVASPEDVALDFIGPFFDNQYKLLLFLIVVVLGFSIIGITGRRIGKSEVYLRGFEDGRKSKEN
jgi:C4-dicarboxylate-specific signal transduction histidine kinase